YRLDTEDTRDYSRVFFYLVVLSDKILHRKTSKFFCLLSTAFGTHEKSDKMKVCKGLKVEIFLSGFFKKILPAPCEFSNAGTRARPPLAEVVDVGFFCFLFDVKKRNVLIFYIQKPMQETHLKAQYFCEKISLRVDGHFHLKCRNFLQKNSLHINGHSFPIS